MEKHEEILLKDAIRTAIQSRMEINKLKLFIITENILLILIAAGVLTWIEL